MLTSDQFIQVIDERIIPKRNEKFSDEDKILQQVKSLPPAIQVRRQQNTMTTRIRILDWPRHSAGLASIETVRMSNY